VELTLHRANMRSVRYVAGTRQFERFRRLRTNEIERT
jgi:hypothetical protein